MAKARSEETASPKSGASDEDRHPRHSSRRDKLASLETARKKEQRNRTIRLLVICLVLAMALLAYPVYLFIDDYRARTATSQTSAAALPTQAATRSPRMRPPGTKITFRTAPR